MTTIADRARLGQIIELVLKARLSALGRALGGLDRVLHVSATLAVAVDIVVVDGVLGRLGAVLVDWRSLAHFEAGGG